MASAGQEWTHQAGKHDATLAGHVLDDRPRGEPLHVAHIIDELPPDGAERLLVDILKHRDPARRYSVVCLIRGGVLADELERMGISVVVIARRSRLDWALLLRLRDWLLREDVQVVHTHLFTADCWGRIAARLAGIECIFSTVHSTNTWKRRLHRLVDWSLSWISSRVIACSHEVGEILVDRDHLSRQRVAVIANGVDMARFDQVKAADLSAEFGIPEDVPVMAVIGRLHPAKGHAELIPALESLGRGLEAFFCLFVGDGELREELEQAVKARGLEGKVIFTGLRRDVPSLLKRVDIVLMPSRWEGLPMALLEAMAMAKPVLATAVGGIPDVIEHGHTGLLVEPGNGKELADQLRVLVGDRELQSRLGQRARELVVQRYDVHVTARRYDDLYDDARWRSARPSVARARATSRGTAGRLRPPSGPVAAPMPG